MGPTTKISYAADWSEYHSYRPNDGSNDILFPLDPLWANANINYVGIDNYLPMGDWRDGDHLDRNAGYISRRTRRSISRITSKAANTSTGITNPGLTGTTRFGRRSMTAHMMNTGFIVKKTFEAGGQIIIVNG